ncbi:MAG: FAD-binding oxidoreductase [Candidatus Lokiarchaeota archaeon]|nr:FAD-binding oxidoreductase [Candidatus Lokiarchaeota archaeon]
MSNMIELYNKLESIVSKKYISNSIYVRHAYSRNVDPILQGVPEMVIRPKDAHEISEILKVANKSKIPVIPRGGGDCEFGGSKPIGDVGILLDMKRMDNIINLDEENLIVTVEAGISWGKLNEYLCNFGLYTGCMGPGSGMTASIGGGISHHSVGGGGCAKYGACTNQLVSLEVVLPTGDIIETGSQANKFSQTPFNRFGNGPDLAGIFCGDNGIFGIKTKVSLQVFPRPEFAEYKTFQLPRKEREVSAKILSEIRHKGIDVYDAMYIMDLIIRISTEQGAFPMFEDLKKKRGIMFYTVEANSEQELDQKVKQLDRIMEDNKAEYLGPEISDGNLAKWHYTEQGHWQFYHNLWGLFPAMEPLTGECFCPINDYPKILNDIDQWDMENDSEMRKIFEITKTRPISGSGPILLIDGNNVEITCGFTSFGSYFDGETHDIIEEINLKLWRSFLERVTRHGVQWYMMGDFMSRLMVDVGAYTEEYYNMMRSIKKQLDPNMIISRGKFNFWGEK